MLAVKNCRECGKSLPLSSFYTHSQMLDGHLNKCKECVRGRVANHRLANVERIRAYDRQRNALPHRVAAREEYAEKLPPEYHIERTRAWQQLNPTKRLAHIIVGNAIRDGKLIKQPCEVCGAAKVEAHHDDYTKPLTVRWLCHKHHMAHHVAERDQRRLNDGIPTRGYARASARD